MKRMVLGTLASLVLGLAVTVVQADVRTQERTQVKFEGMLGRVVGMFGGKAAKEGLVSTVAIKGDRRMTVTGDTGEIVDLNEEKVYRLDMKKKTYTVVTFAELRKQMEEARAKAEQQMKESQQAKEEPKSGTGKPEMEVDFDVKKTGQTRTIAGHGTHEVVITVTVREKGKTLEDGGGMVLTSNAWLAERIPALAEVGDFNRRYFQKLAGPVGAGASAEQLAAAMAMYPGMKAAIERMQKEDVKMDGSPLLTTMVMEGVKSKEQMSQEQQASQESGGGGIGGMLARKMMKKPENAGPRSTVMTSSTEVLSVDPTASDTDVMIPAGFKEKK
jgi:hypothetical protein